ncbi:MAG: hypothetical protein KAT58_01230 [candidate division Zixibacteria bacterium]|nr:hypothetical protein [candidate division Zixibacteria bacterium]
MKIEEYAEQELGLGRKVLQRNGIWWKELKTHYYIPLNRLRAFDRGESRPDRFRVLVGYEHLVSSPDQANSAYISMETNDKESYSLENFKKKRRYCIRRGLDELEMRKMEDFDEFLIEGYKLILVAYQRFDWPGSHQNILNRARFEKTLRRTFGLKGRYGYGAYYQGCLIGYLTVLEIEETVYVNQLITHTDYLRLYPSEALLYSFTREAFSQEGVERVAFGPECAKESLNRFKEAMGFKRVKYPMYRWVNPLLKPAIRLTRYRHYLNQQF